ncbi:MAG: hypothetical protein JSR46_08835 [Verrucomicrobia bacterium]|nr:hypothetical protein [Verrucomicrobiota bacterium]
MASAAVLGVQGVSFAVDSIPSTVVLIKEEALQQQNSLKKLNLQIDLAEKDIKAYGLQKSSLEKEIVSRLSKAHISVTNESKEPKLLLRITSKPADDIIATIVQFSFFESGTFDKNRSDKMAITWSEGALLTSKKENVSKDVNAAVDRMVDNFVREFT